MHTKVHIILLFSLLSLTACGQVRDTTKTQTDSLANTDSLKNCRYNVEGVASYYSNVFNGRRTASGEIFANNLMTAAHKTLPLGSYARVTNLLNNKSVIVKINDRMPSWNKREIDITLKAAAELEFVRAGTTHVRVQSIEKKQ